MPQSPPPSATSSDPRMPPDLPAALAAGLAHQWAAYLESAAEHGARVLAEGAERTAMLRAWAASDFVAQACVADPALPGDLVASGDLEKAYPEGHYRDALDRLLEGVADEADLARRLRLFRRREMVRIAWRDLALDADLDEVLAEVSALAEACIDGALERLHAWHCAQFGEPHGAESGTPQRLVVLGMGKLGARELNFSSDVDLIFAYPEAGATRGAREITNERFFLRLGQRLITALDERTAEGFVFRVDMRLRPYGDSGPLAMSFGALEHYYQSQGREWERYAMIKARVVGGDRRRGGQLLEILRPFVYRRYLDYGAFESLREMKAMIAREMRHKHLARNVKLGPGGIREIEFIGQAFQLIRGGRVPALREQQIQKVLGVLSAQRLLPDYAAAELIAAYRYLRRVENRLQEFADRQTHELPRDAAARARLAYAMGAGDWAGFSAELEQHRERVGAHFDQVFAAPQSEDAGDAAAGEFSALWQAPAMAEAEQETLRRHGFTEPGEAARALLALRDSHACRALSGRGRARLDRLMPLLIGAVAASEQPDLCLPRVLALVEAIARRTAYLSLLGEHPLVLSQLVKLAAASPWIARLLTRHPILLDELLDPRTLYQPASREQLERELREKLAAVDADDLEQQMEVLRHFKQAQVLRVAAADVGGVLPLMIVSDHLTEIAEVLLQAVLELAWAQIAARHGVPRYRQGGASAEAGFCVLAYGKLGGIEFGYGSDLDIVFLHDSAGEDQHTDGERPVDNGVFFARLGQRIIHLLATATASGVLYEVDTRLRPSGASGLLVCSVDSFADYQRGQAWTWEHQALVRARPVAGSAAIAARFEAVRAEILARPREREALRGEVREMRARMREQLGRSGEGMFDLKQDFGGIADIEFLVQYQVLAWASREAGVYRYTDNIRQLDALAAGGIMPEADVERLKDIYRDYRKRAHRLTLQEQAAIVPEGEYLEECAFVRAQWKAIMMP